MTISVMTKKSVVWCLVATLVVCLALLAIGLMGGGSVADAVEAGDGYILFTCTSSFTLATTSESASWDGTLYY